MENVPQYVLGVKKSRYIVPRIIEDTILIAIFISLILIILNQLRIRLDMELYLVIAGIFIVILAIDILATYVGATKVKYNFYLDRIDIVYKKTRTLMLGQVIDVYAKKDIFDVFTSSTTIYFKPKFKLIGIDNPEQMIPYIKSLVQNARYNQQYNAQNITGAQMAQNYINKK